MDTKQKLGLPLKNELVRNKIFQTLSEFSVLQLHIFQPKNTEHTEVFILMKDAKDAEMLLLRNWVNKAATIDKIKVHISYLHKAAFQLKGGNPFYQYYADRSTLVWLKEGVPKPLKTTHTKKTFRKKRSVFEDKFYHDHDILMREATKYQSHQMFSSAFQNYLSLFEHHVEYLENLYTGWINFDQDLHKRLRQLIRYIPQIQKVFVMENHEKFYMISKMEKSLTAAAGDDEFSVSADLFDAVKVAETHLYKLVVDRLSEFRRIILFKKSSWVIIPPAEVAVTVDVRLGNAITSLVERLSPEEIYLFHKKESYSQADDTPKIVYYFLLIGDSLSHTKIVDTQQSIDHKSGGKVSVVILGHRRLSLQKRLYAAQDFMLEIMTSDNLVYASHQYHPPLHWHHSSSSDNDGDLPIYYKRMSNNVKHYFTARATIEKESDEIVILLFSHALMGILRLYLYCSLCSYLPNFYKMVDTWKLCIYADPSLEKIEFLFDKINPDFFKLADSFLKYTDRPHRFAGDDLIVMDEIINLLVAKLENQIKNKNLTAQIE